MAFDLYETCFINLSNESAGVDTNLLLSRLKESASGPGMGMRTGPTHFPAVIYPQFHVLTADKITRNKTLYSTSAHKGSKKDMSGQHSFTNPYPIPIINEHMSSAACGNPPSTVYGRMVAAKYVKNKETGIGHLAGLGEITHRDGIEDLLTGRWLTGSLGSSINEAKCSICGTSYNDSHTMDSHIHRRGSYYRSITRQPTTSEAEPDAYGFEETDSKDPKGRMCYTHIDGYHSREYSKVITPSDDQSMVDVPDTRLQKGSHFTGLSPTSHIAPPAVDPDDDNADRSATPKSSIWVPMTRSIVDGVNNTGERYIDLVTGKEALANDLGLLSGDNLQQYVERLNSSDQITLVEALALPQSRALYSIDFQETEIEDCECTDVNEGITESVQTQEDVLTTAKRKSLAKNKPSVFCGPGNSFPISNKLHYSMGLRLLSRYKGPGDKSKIRACILAKGRKNGWASGSAKKENNMSDTQTHALVITATLASGKEAVYKLFPKSTTEERADSLVSLESTIDAEGMSDLLASLTEEQETQVREMLSTEATGDEEALEIEIDETNYLLLAAITSSDEATGTVPLTESFIDINDSKMCDGISTNETMKHVRTGLKQIEKIMELLESPKDNTELLKLVINLSEKILGDTISSEEDFKSHSIESLSGMATYIAKKALASSSETEDTAKPPQTPKLDTSNDTNISEVSINSPLASEETTVFNLSFEDDEEDGLPQLDLTILQGLRKAAPNAPRPRLR